MLDIKTSEDRLALIVRIHIPFRCFAGIVSVDIEDKPRGAYVHNAPVLFQIHHVWSLQGARRLLQNGCSEAGELGFFALLDAPHRSLEHVQVLVEA